jgi:hypothetical protein
MFNLSIDSTHMGKAPQSIPKIKAPIGWIPLLAIIWCPWFVKEIHSSI